MPVAPVDKEAKRRNKNLLSGQGGVFNPINMSLYRYSGNNSIKYVDPDGRDAISFDVSFNSHLFAENSEGIGIAVDTKGSVMLYLKSDLGVGNQVEFDFSGNITYILEM